MIVAREPLPPEALSGKRIAVPGKLTSAVLALALWRPGLDQVVVPFDQIPDAVLAGQADAGLLIHEGQVTYGSQGLHKIIDLGEWWSRETGLPLPLGGNVIRKDMGPDLMRRVSRLLRESIQYGLDHRDEALSHAMRYGRDLDRPLTDRFVGMYVNDWTLHYGPRGREAVRLFLKRGHERSILPARVEPEFVED
jgi:1,4-dihydroxy-6-naphthoate synthase